MFFWSIEDEAVEWEGGVEVEPAAVSYINK